jgi:stalled ribosome rescue protein Dom34
MKTRAGLWIDHKKAIVVAVTDKGEETRLIISKVEKNLSRSGDSPLEGSHYSQQVPADDSRQRRLTGQLNIYYDAVIASIRDAESILIFGPGEAKDELRKRLKKDNLDGRIVGMETVDKMTDHQVAAKVRQHFQDTSGPH